MAHLGTVHGSLDVLVRSVRPTMLIALVTVIACIGAAALHHPRVVTDPRPLNLALTSVTMLLLLLTATLRMSVHSVTRLDADRVRFVCALLVATVLVPSHLWTHGALPMATSTAETASAGAARALTAVVVGAALGLAVAQPRRRDRLILVGSAAVIATSVVLATAATVGWWPHHVATTARLLSVVAGASWALVAAFVASRGRTRPWSASMPPLLLILGATEVVVAWDPRVPGVGATAAVLLMLAIGVLALARARADLLGTLRAERGRTAQLEQDLRRARENLAGLQQRERRLAHDARGTLAGMRAALHIWGEASTTTAASHLHDPALDGTALLRAAAFDEIRRLDAALVEHRIELGAGPVALDHLAARAARALSDRGAEIVVDVPPLVVRGQVTDLEATLEAVLEHGICGGRHRILLSADHEAGVATLTVARLRTGAGHAEDVLTAPSDKLDVARDLLQRLQGDLVLDRLRDVVRLRLPLCPAPPRVRSGGPDSAVTRGVRLPRQRDHSPGAYDGVRSPATHLRRMPR